MASAVVKRVGDGHESVRRRRLRAEAPRQRQVVVRFSDEELVLVRERATLAGLAVGAWIGQLVLGAAQDGPGPAAGLPDLLRLHVDVVLAERAAVAGGVGHAEVAGLLARLDAAIDAVVAELERGRR